MIIFSSFGVNNFVKFKGVEKEEYMVTSHRENGSKAGKRFGLQDHGTWLLNRMSEPYYVDGSICCRLYVRCPVVVYVTEPRVMLWAA